MTLRCAAQRRVEAPSSIEPPDEDGCVIRVTPESAGWSYVGFEVYRLAAGARLARTYDGSRDVRRLPLGARDVSAGDGEWRDVGGRASRLRRAADARSTSRRDGVVGRGGRGARARRLHRAGRPRRRASPARAGGHAARVARQRRRGARDRPHPDGGRARRVAARNGGRHAGRPLVQLSASQARRRRPAARDVLEETYYHRIVRRTASRSSASTRRTARSTRRSPSATARSCSCRGATTRWPRARATTSTT